MQKLLSKDIGLLGACSWKSSPPKRVIPGRSFVVNHGSGVLWKKIRRRKSTYTHSNFKFWISQNIRIRPQKDSQTIFLDFSPKKISLDKA